MMFTLENVLNSLATVLKEKYPQHPVYYNPNQQGTDFPCFFIFYMPSTVEGQMDNRFMRDLGIDIVFVQQRNIVNGNAEILAIAQYLDEVLELFAYSDGSEENREVDDTEPEQANESNGKTVMLRTVERQWQTEDGELHYQFHIKQRVYIPKDVIPMGEMEVNADVEA